MSMVIVENSGEKFASKFDGRTYSFNTGDAVPISMDAARHIFGFGLADKTEVLSRHSWMSRSTEYDEAMKRLGQFRFTSGEVKVIPSMPQPEVQEQEHSDKDVVEHRLAPMQPDTGAGEKLSDGIGKEAFVSTNKQGRPELATDVIFT